MDRQDSFQDIVDSLTNVLKADELLVEDIFKNGIPEEQECVFSESFSEGRG